MNIVDKGLIFLAVFSTACLIIAHVVRGDQQRKERRRRWKS